ncbi:uncharacterized protein TNCV_141851 [Trichonephila clavipes]|nr:uncharacterized protein TNCV_141851 [Trichonephila clavipes]
MEEKFWHQKGLLVDAPKPGFRTSNYGNTARAFFQNLVTALSITGIYQILIRKLHVGLTTIACGHDIDAQFKEFCQITAELYVALYPWYYMSQSLQKVLMQGGLINDSILPIGQMSKEAYVLYVIHITKLGIHFAVN